MKRPSAWWGTLLVVVGFVLGVGVRQLVFIVDFSPPIEHPVQPVTVRVQSAEQVVQTRAALIRYLFDSEVLPTDLPIDNEDGTYLVRMSAGVTSVVRLMEPTNPRGALVIYHAGHGGYAEADRAVVDALLEVGYTVVVFDMPLTGVNATELVVDLPNGPVTMSRHDHLALLDPLVAGSPIRLFLEPVVVMLNELAGDYSEIAMIGLSGGGWTTTLAAAIDLRIDRSYPVAGSLPLAVQFAREDGWGDWEQNEPTLYAIAGFVDLYVLGSHERRQLQVLNQFDPCCFMGDYRSAYEEEVQSAVRAAGGGSFSVLLDSANREHSVGPAALQAIIADMEAAED